MAYRSSAGNLGVYEDDRRPAPARWDRDKFERYSRADPAPSVAPERERDQYHFEEHDRYGPRGERHDIEIDERYSRAEPPPRQPRFVDDLDDDRGFRRRPTDFLEEPVPAEVSNRALAPYRPPPPAGYGPGPGGYGSPARRPTRPTYIRRQSSLDTFDRKPYPRYGDYEREDYRQALATPPRFRAGRRGGPGYEEDWEEIQYRDDDEPSVWEEDYRDIRIRRKRSRRSRPGRARSSSSDSSASGTTRMSGTTAKSGKSHKSRRSSTTKKHSSKKSHHHHHSSRKSRSAVRSGETVRSSSSSSSSSESTVATNLPGKRGRTKMPRRLVHVKAVIELGYPYYEEGDFIFVRRALTKPQIDEVIKSSEKYIDKMTTYRYENSTSNNFVPPPPESVTSSGTGYREHAGAHSRRSRSHSRRRRNSVGSYGSSTTIVNEYEHRSNHGGTSHPYNTIVSPPSNRARSRSRSRTIVDEQSSRIAGPLVVLTPEQQQRRRELEVREEFRTLEIDRPRDRVEYDEIVLKEPRDTIRVEKDRKGRMALVRSAH